MSTKSDMIVALMEDGMSLERAKAFAEKFVEAHPEAAVPTVPQRPAGPQGQLMPLPPGQSIASAIPMVGVSPGGLPVPAFGQDELKRRQVAEYVAAGRTLCPNCQQPTTDHLPGCARQTQEDPRAVTKTPLAPVV